MFRITSIRLLLCVVAATLALATTANATTLVRSFISSGGNDSNASTTGCVVTAPCRTLATAYANTQSAGEIVMMNAGGYGCVTITTPITILGTDGAVVTATSGACIVVNAPGDSVYIKNLELTGANVSGTIGVQLTAGKLVVHNVGFKNLGTGLVVGNNSAVAHADVIGCDFIGNTTGIVSNGTGIDTSTSPPYTGTQTLVRISGGNAINNTNAFGMQNAAQDTNQNCKLTFFMYTTSNGLTMNVVGYTTYMTVGPASNPPFGCTNIQTYVSTVNQPGPN